MEAAFEDLSFGRDVLCVRIYHLCGNALMQWNRLGEGTGKEGRGEQNRAKRARKTVKNRNF